MNAGMIVRIVAISIAIILRAIGHLMIDLAIAKRIKKTLINVRVNPFNVPRLITNVVLATFVFSLFSL